MLPLTALWSGGDRCGQIEAGEYLGAAEGHDLLDLAAAQREDVQTVRHEGAGLFVPEVGSGCRLPVCRGRNQAPAGALGEQVAADEGGDLPTAAVPGRTRRHRDPGVLGEHRDEGVDIVPLPGGNVALDEPAQLVVAETAKRLLLRLAGEPFVYRLVRSLQGAVDRYRCRLQRRSGLSGGEAEDVAEDQHRPLARRQVLECRDEGKLDTLALLIASVRTG